MSFLPEFQPSRDLPTPVSPALLVGAVSPLWPYFSGLAATGVAWWWMTRLAPQNLEAMFAAVAPKPPESVVRGPELPPVVGGEAAPVSPVLADVPPEPRTLDAAPEAELAPPKPRRPPATPPVADA